MSDQTEQNPEVEEIWRIYMTTGEPPDHARPFWYESRKLRPLVRRLPKDPRCRVCLYPFEGLGGKLVKGFLGVESSKLNPELCNTCERFARKYQGGAEIEMTILFADVRGSTGLAEGMSAVAFSRLINRFYQTTTKVLYDNHAFVEKLIGDAVTGFFVAGFVGPGHARVAVDAGRMILEGTGHRKAAGPWIPVGVGIHTGVAYVGAVTREGGVVDIAVLGDTANTAARLSSLAGQGELILSEAVRLAAGLHPDGLEARHLSLKGRSEPVDAWVLSVHDQMEAA